MDKLYTYGFDLKTNTVKVREDPVIRETDLTYTIKNCIGQEVRFRKAALGKLDEVRVMHLFYKRYDAKKGKPVPEGAIKCQEEADEVTGHFPCWVKVDAESKTDKWFIAAYEHRAAEIEEIYHEDPKAHLVDGTYEAIGKHFNGNPYNLDFDTIEPHGKRIIYCDVNSFEAAKIWLEKHPEHEGIVWWHDGKPVCKLKRSDFGLKFPIEKRKE